MIKRELFVGFTGSILAMITVFIVGNWLFIGRDLEETLQIIELRNLYIPVLTLCSLVNLGLFFLFLKKRPYRARGVLMATICVAIAVLLLKIVH